MPDIELPIQAGDHFQEEIHNGILAGIADAEAGRVKELNQDYADDLKARVRAKLENRTLYRLDVLLIIGYLWVCLRVFLP